LKNPQEGGAGSPTGQGEVKKWGGRGDCFFQGGGDRKTLSVFFLSHQPKGGGGDGGGTQNKGQVFPPPPSCRPPTALERDGLGGGLFAHNFFFSGPIVAGGPFGVGRFGLVKPFHKSWPPARTQGAPPLFGVRHQNQTVGKVVGSGGGRPGGNCRSGGGALFFCYKSFFGRGRI